MLTMSDIAGVAPSAIKGACSGDHPSGSAEAGTSPYGDGRASARQTDENQGAVSVSSGMAEVLATGI